MSRWSCGYQCTLAVWPRTLYGARACAGRQWPCGSEIEAGNFFNVSEQADRPTPRTRGRSAGHLKDASLRDLSECRPPIPSSPRRSPSAYAEIWSKIDRAHRPAALRGLVRARSKASVPPSVFAGFGACEFTSKLVYTHDSLAPSTSVSALVMAC